MTNAFPTLPLLREGWFVKHDGGSGLPESVLIRLTQMKASQPSDLVFPHLVHWDRKHQHCDSAVSTFSLRFKDSPFPASLHALSWGNKMSGDAWED